MNPNTYHRIMDWLSRHYSPYTLPNRQSIPVVVQRAHGVALDDILEEVAGHAQSSDFALYDAQLLEHMRQQGMHLMGPLGASCRQNQHAWLFSVRATFTGWQPPPVSSESYYKLPNRCPSQKWRNFHFAPSLSNSSRWRNNLLTEGGAVPRSA